MKKSFILILVALFTAVTAQANTLDSTKASRGADDGYSGGSVVDTSSTSLYIGSQGAVPGPRFFFRFTNVQVPQGKTIDSAFLYIRATSTDPADSAINCGYTIYAEDVDNSTAITETDTATFNARPLTSASTSYTLNVMTWNNGTYYFFPLQSIVSGGFKSVVQEVVDRPGWSAGNAMTIRVHDNAPATNRYRRTRSWEYNSTNTYSPRLLIWWSSGSTSSGGTGVGVRIMIQNKPTWKW